MIFVSKHTFRFLENFSWLFLFNNLGYLFSFISLPILISKYGLKDLGVVFTIQAIVLGMSSIANYSLVYYIPTVSKKISNNDLEFSKLWSLSVFVRLIISILLSIISIVIVVVFYKAYLILWLFSLPILLSKIISPNLFCNAIEKNKYIFKIGFFTKLLFLFAIYTSKNIVLINLFFGLSELLVILFFLSKISPYFFRIKFIYFKDLTAFVTKTFNLFLVNFFSLLKPASILPIITYFIGSEFATLYTLSEKIMNVIRGVSGSMFVSFFPIYNKEKITMQILTLKNTFIVFVLSAIAVVIVYFLSPFLIYYLNNFTHNKIAATTLQILSLAIPMFFIIIPLFSYLLEFKKWNAILLFSIIQLLSLFILIFYLPKNILEIAKSIVLSEYIMLSFYFFYVLKLENRKV